MPLSRVVRAGPPRRRNNGAAERIIEPSPTRGRQPTIVALSVLGAALRQVLRTQQFFVENKPGAGNMIGIEDGCARFGAGVAYHTAT
jgi:hypothetical protein